MKGWEISQFCIYNEIIDIHAVDQQISIKLEFDLLKDLSYKSKMEGMPWSFGDMYTHGHNVVDAWFLQKCFNSFDSLPIGIKKQMISHLKALVKSFENQE